MGLFSMGAIALEQNILELFRLNTSILLWLTEDFLNALCPKIMELGTCWWLLSQLSDRIAVCRRSFMMTSSNGNIFRVTCHLQVPGEFPIQRPVTRSFDVYFDLRLNKRLCKQSCGWWFVTLLCPLWRHSNVLAYLLVNVFSLQENAAKAPTGIPTQLLECHNGYCWAFFTSLLRQDF